MAFIRKRLSSRMKYYRWYSFQWIETYRASGKVKQRVLANLGTFRSGAHAAQLIEESGCVRWRRPVPEEYRTEIG